MLRYISTVHFRLFCGKKCRISVISRLHETTLSLWDVPVANDLIRKKLYIWICYIVTRPGLLEAWLVLTSVKYHGNLYILIPLNQRLALTRLRATGPWTTTDPVSLSAGQGHRPASALPLNVRPSPFYGLLSASLAGSRCEMTQNRKMPLQAQK